MGQLIHARKPVPPRRRVELGGSVVLALFAVLELLTGSWQLAVGAAAGAVLMVPLVYFAAGKTAGRHPDWIEVRPDGITAVRASGASWELVRNSDSVLRVQGTARPGTRIVLRDGRQGPLPWANNGVTPKLVIALTVIVASGILALAFAGASPTAIMIAVFGPSLLLALALVGLSVRHALRVTLTVTVSPDRVTVTHGTLASQVVQRTAVTSARVGRYYVRLRGPESRTLLAVPLNPQRTAVLNALSANGWPV